MRPLHRLFGTGLVMAQAIAASGFVWLTVAPALAVGVSAALLSAAVAAPPPSAQVPRTIDNGHSTTIRGASASREARTDSHFCHTRRAIAR